MTDNSDLTNDIMTDFDCDAQVAAGKVTVIVNRHPQHVLELLDWPGITVGWDGGEKRKEKGRRL